MRTSGSLALVATAALVLTLTSCSGGPGGDKLDYDDSPLNQYLSAAWGGDMSPEEQEKRFAEQQREEQQLMAECMAAEGFEYTPNIQDGGMIFTGDDVEWDPESRDWVEKYGYGTVNNPWNEQMQDAPIEESTDPNQEYVEALSESERDAYYETLYGAPQTEDDMVSEDGSYEWRWEDAGCQGWAQHEVQGDNPWSADEFADLRQKMEQLWSSTQESPELKDLNAEWATCMADAGEPGFTVQYDAAQTISDEQQRIYEEAWGDGSTEVDYESMEDPNESDAMKALGEREIELALKDFECRQKTSYFENTLKIQFAQEEKFVADNKAALDAFKAAAEQSK